MQEDKEQCILKGIDIEKIPHQQIIHFPYMTDYHHQKKQ
jgi:hypothetical protein